MAERLVLRRDDDDDELEPRPVCVPPRREGRLPLSSAPASCARCRDRAPSRAKASLRPGPSRQCNALSRAAANSFSC